MKFVAISVQSDSSGRRLGDRLGDTLVFSTPGFWCRVSSMPARKEDRELTAIVVPRGQHACDWRWQVTAWEEYLHRQLRNLSQGHAALELRRAFSCVQRTTSILVCWSVDGVLDVYRWTLARVTCKGWAYTVTTVCIRYYLLYIVPNRLPSRDSCQILS